MMVAIFGLLHPILAVIAPFGFALVGFVMFALGPITAYCFFALMAVIAYFGFRRYYRHHQAERYDSKLPADRMAEALEEYIQGVRNANVEA